MQGQKAQFSIKTQFCDFACFMLITSMFVPNLELIGSSNRIKDVKYHFFPLKMVTDPCLNLPRYKNSALLLWSFCAHLKSSDKENYNMGQYWTYYTSPSLSSSVAVVFSRHTVLIHRRDHRDSCNKSRPIRY